MTTIDQSRKQVADLILKGPYGRDLVVCSDLRPTDPGTVEFVVGDQETGQRFTVTVHQEEV